MINKISKSLGSTFEFNVGTKSFDITGWELVDKGIAVYSNGIYKGTVLKESEDYKLVKQDLKENSVN